MAERQSLIPSRFIDHYATAYPPVVPYTIDTLGQRIEGTSTHAFRSSRRKLMQNLFEGDPKHELMSQGLVAEQLTRLALDPLLKEAGFLITLAPQSLEHGEQQKGVDLIIKDSDSLAYLGIDVKLRREKSPLDRDSHGWNRNLKAPYIYLSLGNWDVSLPGKDEATVKDWLRDETLPKLMDTGKIPLFNSFRQYLIKRIERSVYGYQERLVERNIFPRVDTVPEKLEDMDILQEKIGVMRALFTDLRHNY